MFRGVMVVADQAFQVAEQAVGSGELAGTHVVDEPWFPFVLAVFAAATAYWATWLYKHRDVQRELAMRGDDILDRAAETTALSDESFGGASGYQEVKEHLRRARLVVKPLRDADLDYRLLVAERFAFDTFGWTVPRVWLGEAIENARAGLRGYLAPPRFAPWRKGASSAERSFPTHQAYSEAEVETEKLFEWIDSWMSQYQLRTRWSRRARMKRWVKRQLRRPMSPYEPS